MSNMIGVHWIPTHRGGEDRERFAAWNPAWVKIVAVDERPPYLEDIPSSSQIVVRCHPLSENYGTRDLRDAVAAVTIGNLHADACKRMADYCMSRGVPVTRLAFEGLNEPQLWSTEPPELVARYYFAFLKRLHEYGLAGVVGNFGVGWPGNGGVQDAPVQWDFFKPVANEMRAGDYLGLHEYWALNGPQENWRWWAGRFLQCPYRVPILITETGIDLGVTGQHYGAWWDLPGNTEQKAARYVDELHWYVQQCKTDGRVQAVFPFTYDIGSAHWEKFDVRNEVFVRTLIGRGEVCAPGWTWQTLPVPSLTTALKAKAAECQVLQLNPEAAIQKRLLTDGFVPTSGEFMLAHDGRTYIAQRAERLRDGAVRVYYCLFGSWDRVLYV
jgi:hypothetical protein